MRFFLFALFLFTSLQAAFVIEGGKIKNERYVAKYSAEKHYEIATRAFELKNFDMAYDNYQAVALSYPSSSLGPDSAFYAAVCLYEMGDLDLSNEAFSDYLKLGSSPKYFQEVMTYKFTIANEFRCGARRRVFGTKQLPKWQTANTLALKIYDEIIQVIPCHEYAAQSLFAKGYMLWQRGEYQESVEAYQMLIRRFPKHELTPEAYLCITRVFLEQCEWEFQNPDLLQLAELNVKRFRQEFPRDENVKVALEDLNRLKETYACGLYKTGQLYEKKNAPNASIIYYRSAVKYFPETEISKKCLERIEKISSLIKNDQSK